MKKCNIFFNILIILLPTIIGLPLIDTRGTSLSGIGGELFILSIGLFIIFILNNKKILIPLNIKKLTIKTISYIVIISIFDALLSISLLTIFTYLKWPCTGGESTSDNQILLNILYTTFFASICEEILFRDALLTLFSKMLPINIAILMQGLIFGFLHSPNIKSIIFYSAFFAGIFLGCIFYYTKSILCTIIQHSIYNFIVVFIYSNYTISNTFEFIGFIVLAAFSLVLIITLISRIKYTLET